MKDRPVFATGGALPPVLDWHGRLVEEAAAVQRQCFGQDLELSTTVLALETRLPQSDTMARTSSSSFSPILTSIRRFLQLPVWRLFKRRRFDSKSVPIWS